MAGIPFLRRRATGANPGAAASTKSQPCRSPRTTCHFNAILCLLVLCVWVASLLFSGAVFHVCFTSRKLNVYCIHANFTRDADTVRSVQLPSSVASKDGQHPPPSLPNTTTISTSTTTAKVFNTTSASTNIPAKVINTTSAATPTTTNIPARVINATSAATSTTTNITAKVINTTSAATSTTIDIPARVINATSAATSTTASSTSSNASKVVNATRDEEMDEWLKAIMEVERRMGFLRSLAVPSNASGEGCQGRGVYVYELPLKFNLDIMGHCHEMLPWQDLCGYFTNDAMGEILPSLGKGWYSTHQYSLEPIFHQRALRHPCRVRDPDEAKLFYVPFYAGLDVLRLNFHNGTNEAKDELSHELVRWLEGQASWRRNQGRDHVFVLGKVAWDFRRQSAESWGTSFLNLKEMENPYKLMIERQPWEPHDVGIPHPTHFHPHSDEDIAVWQRRVFSSPRKHAVCFAGGPRKNAYADVRSVLIEQCRSAPDEGCKYRDCRFGNCDRAEELMVLFMASDFCLQPIGDSPTRKSVFDGLVAGCIPVFFDPFTAYYQYPWHLPEDHGRYSVLFDKEEVKAGKVNVVEKLNGISVKEREEMRRFIVCEIMPGLVYGDATSEFHNFTDAFGIAMRNVMHVVTTSVRR